MRCAEPGCITILSRSNPGKKCRIHADPRWKQVGGTPARRRIEELAGKHPEDLEWQFRDRKEWAS